MKTRKASKKLRCTYKSIFGLQLLFYIKVKDNLLFIDTLRMILWFRFYKYVQQYKEGM